MTFEEWWKEHPKWLGDVRTEEPGALQMAVVRAAWEASAAAQRERCATAVAKELLEEPDGNPIASAYNDAVFNCITACRTANAEVSGGRSPSA